MEKRRVFIIAEPLSRRLELRNWLNQADHVTIVGTEADGFSARQKIRAAKIDHILLDLTASLDPAPASPQLPPLPYPITALGKRRDEVLNRLSQRQLTAAEIVIYGETLSWSGGLKLPPPSRATSPSATLLRGAPLRAPSEPATSYAASQNNAMHNNMVEPRLRIDDVLTPRTVKRQTTPQRTLIAIGASTGGTEAIQTILKELAPPFPPIVIVQHIPPRFSTQFAQRLNRSCELTVVEAAHDQPIEANHAYLAPGNFHLLVQSDAQHFRCRLSDRHPPINRHRPSVDALFRSVAQGIGAGAIGVLLTGMGDDGAAGLAEMRATGATTLVQNEESSLVWGMPGAAVRRNAATKILPLDEMATALQREVALRTTGRRAVGGRS